MEWNDIHLFLVVARHGSIGSAARELQLSHPTVARRLRILEDEVGQVLLQRHTTGVVLTDAGEAALPVVKEVEGPVLAMQRKIAGEGDHAEGTLRIAAFDWFAEYLLPPVLHELTRHYPRIVPQLIIGHRSFSLSRREADIAFRAGPFNEPDVMQRRLRRVTYGLYAGRGVPDPIEGDGAGSALLLMDTSTPIRMCRGYGNACRMRVSCSAVIAVNCRRDCACAVSAWRCCRR